MKTKPAIYAGLVACAVLVMIHGANDNLIQGLAIGVATLIGTVIYARSVGRRLD
ncbi:hypothetical protein SAMN05428969_2865 [Devosia sp. YR412]|uniref:hypothetical protein n=1 Tax=Devosia sp. YR412 TaxID=1881030 RepID=UPI0008CD5180|nr:hypothetical protein [Devosia sp. YR412]SEQ38669.1 hypothetical protein SAMN05428969_2865 [Devosia sp. YR412]